MFLTKNHLYPLGVTWLIAVILISGLIYFKIFCWNVLDYKFIDFLFSHSLNEETPNNSPITYVLIDDKTYKEIFRKNYLDREILAKTFELLYDYQPNSVALEMIFAFPNEPYADSTLANTLKKFCGVYLPFSFQFTGDSLISNKVNLPPSSFNPIVRNKQLNRDYYVNRIIEQQKIFSSSSKNNVQLNEISDEDDVFRKTIPVINIGNKLYPSMALSIFMNYMGINPDNVKINWGENIIIPSKGSLYLKNDVVIPIDECGKIYIPFSRHWPNDFNKISLQQIIKYHDNVLYYGNLVDRIEGRIIFVCDISSGGLNWGRTSIGDDAPLIMIQAAVLNALFENHFYSQISTLSIFFIFLISALLILIFSLLKKKAFYYLNGLFIPIVIIIFCQIEIFKFIIIPVTSLIFFHLFLFITLLVHILVIDSKEKKELSFENQRKKIEFEEAKKIQLSMLPVNISSNGLYDYSVLYKTADEVGGDYYDIKNCKDEKIKIVIGDATGHGLKAGLMVTIIKTLLLTLENEEDIIGCFEKITMYLKILNLRLMYMCLMILFIKDDKLTWSSAGMPPLIYYNHKEDLIKDYLLKGMPLGAWKNYPYATENLCLGENDAVMVCSDGILELFNAKKEMFGEDRIKQIFSEIKSSSPAEIIDLFKEEIKKWTKGKNIADDICIIIIKRKGIR